MSRRRKKQLDTIHIDPKPIWKAKKGHTERISGSGIHSDRRLKRQKTRRDAINAYFRELE